MLQSPTLGIDPPAGLGLRGGKLHFYAPLACGANVATTDLHYKDGLAAAQPTGYRKRVYSTSIRHSNIYVARSVGEFAALSRLPGPPAKPVQLWAEGGRGIWIADSWGPAVPYPPVVHEDGNRNFGYMRVKGDPEAVKRIPEAQGWPQLQDFLAQESHRRYLAVGCKCKAGCESSGRCRDYLRAEG